MDFDLEKTGLMPTWFLVLLEMLLPLATDTKKYTTILIREEILMNTKAKFQNICAEIKQALGKETSHREILECAQLIMTVYKKDADDKHFLEEARRTMDEKPLFEIWEETPWAIYFRERLFEFDQETE